MLEKRGMELEEELDKLDKMTREGWVWDGRVSGSNKGEGAGVDVRKREILGELELWIGKYRECFLFFYSLSSSDFLNRKNNFSVSMSNWLLYT